MPEKLWTEVHDTVQEAEIKTIPKKKKWLSEEALQMAEKRREVKGKGEKERYTHLNSEFQRIARGDKKAFLSDHCKEIAENNRMGKTRDPGTSTGVLGDHNHSWEIGLIHFLFLFQVQLDISFRL